MFENVVRLASRCLLRVSGNEAGNFLQGLITKDISCIHIYGAIYAFLLNARGRIVSDLLIYKNSDELLLETDASRINALERILKIYRLRKQVDIEIAKDYTVYFANKFSQIANNEILAFEDPRIQSFGYRIIDKCTNLTAENKSDESEYLQKRMEWGIAEGFDEVRDQIPLQVNGDILNGISFEKGCYIGQELIARMHHAGVIRRRVLPITSSTPQTHEICGKILLDENNKRQGKILRTQNFRGIALVSLNFVGKTLFDESQNVVNVHRPHWWPENLP